MTIHQLIRDNAAPAEARLLSLYFDAAGRLPGADLPKVREWRQRSLEAFAALGLPHRRVEEWKYTDLRVLLPEATALAGLKPDGLDVVLDDATLGGITDTYRAVFAGGRFRADLSTVQDVPGVSFRTLSGMLNDATQAAEIVGRMPIVERDVVSALANAFAMDGAVISVAPGTKLDKPLHLIFITAGDSAAFQSWQSAIRIGEGAELQIIETYAGPQAAQIVSALRLEIADRASLRHLRLGTGTSARHLSTVVASLGKGASYDPLHFMPGGALSRAQNFITFNGEGGRCHFHGAMMLRRREHGDMTFVVDHAVPGCESREVVKAVLDGEAHGVFQAKVIVRPGAQKTDGRQVAHGLLLSDTAEFDAKPELEIYADDVKCNHGATSGALDDDMLFYLRSRGIPAEEAKSLLILAFIAEIFDHIEDEQLRDVLTAHVSQWLSA